jgi:hypothetical protein
MLTGHCLRCCAFWGICPIPLWRNAEIILPDEATFGTWVLDALQIFKGPLNILLFFVHTSIPSGAAWTSAIRLFLTS